MTNKSLLSLLINKKGEDNAMRKNLSVLFLLTMVLIPAQQSHALIFYAEDDSLVANTSPNTNYNRFTSGALDFELWTGVPSVGVELSSYLKFNLEGLYSVGAATLYLYNGTASTPATVNAYSTGNSWEEETLTWNNKPGLGALVDSIAVGPAVGWYAWNVTSLVQAHYDDLMSVALASDGASQTYYARESSSGYMPYLRTNAVPEPATILSFSSFVLMFLPGMRRKILR